MKPLLLLLLIAGSTLIYSPASFTNETSDNQPNDDLFADNLNELANPDLQNPKPILFTTQDYSVKKFDEGILYTKVSFPGNVLNDFLSEIDFSRSDIQDQMKKLQQKTNSMEYAEKVREKMDALSAEEKTAMGKMMMGIMFSPLYARIYVSNKEVLAKATALNYTMESYMDNQNGMGRMNVLSNNSSETAAIEFSAKSMKEVWEKEEIGPSRYSIKDLQGKTTIAGYDCNQTVYTYKLADKSQTALSKAPHKLIVWHSDQIGKEINFFHPFYFEINKGILKIEVQYDQAGKVKIIYEVTGTEVKKLSAADFRLTAVEPVLNWDINQAEASMKILQAMMASNE
jgi:hypothetical protein